MRETGTRASARRDTSPVQPIDAEVFAAGEADDRFRAHADWTAERPFEAAVSWWRESIVEPDPQLIRLMAVHEHEPVGYVDLYGDTAGDRELGYSIGPSRHWGKGLGTAAAAAGLAYGFDELRLGRIWAEAVEANVASVRTLQSLRMRETGFGEAAPFLGQRSRYVRFELLRDEWLTRSPGAPARR